MLFNFKKKEGRAVGAAASLKPSKQLFNRAS